MMPLETLPEARLTHKAIFAMDQCQQPRVITDGSQQGIVKYGLCEWPVLIDSSPCHLGGGRRWLVCSECHKKRVALYIAGQKLACRSCLGLRYASQHENRRERARRRFKAIQSRLGWIPGNDPSNGLKPKGMHWMTFARLVKEYSALSSCIHGSLMALTERFKESP